MAAIALSLCLLFAWADDRTAAADFLGDMAAALSSGNARGFLKRIDPAMPGYAQLETEVEALVKLAGVASSVQLLELTAKDDGFDLQVDWFIELKPYGQELSSERRRELLKLRLNRVGKSWKIQSLEPKTIFAAPRL